MVDTVFRISVLIFFIVGTLVGLTFSMGSMLYVVTRLKKEGRPSYYQVIRSYAVGLFLFMLVAAFADTLVPAQMHAKRALWIIGAFILVPCCLRFWFSLSWGFVYLTAIWISGPFFLMFILFSGMEMETSERFTKAHGEMHAVGVSLSAEAERTGTYPIPVDKEGRRVNPTVRDDLSADSVDAPTEETVLCYMGPSFVPPILVVGENNGTVPTDPFHEEGAGPYGYGVGPLSASRGAFILSSIGPDGERQGERLEFLFLDKSGGDRDELEENAEYWSLLYSPTNGTKSSGDIIRLGP